MSSGDGQLRLPFQPFVNRKLFADGFLLTRLPDWPEFERLDVSAQLGQLRDLWERERTGLSSANEAQTEERFIQPVLRALGFSYTVQVNLRGATGRRQPDYALFLTEERRREADRLEGRARFHHAAAVADAKRFDRPLDGQAGHEDPVAQIINYISITRCPWGILTNGRRWRLYAEAGDLVEGACYQVDLPELLESGTEQDFRYFVAFFSAQAFAPDQRGRSFLDRALDESTANAVEVGKALERQVFAAVPLVAQGLLGDTEATDHELARAFDHALVLLYRVLFCLMAEARRLLPVDNPHYAHYSLRAQKEQLARDVAAGRLFSEQSDDLYNDLRALFRIVDRGDAALGVAEYNGGLFSAAGHPYFEGRLIPDALLAYALDGLYRIGGEFVDYRELSVRHLGTIYERLLQFRLSVAGDRLALVPAPGRREMGSYFTPEPVVDRIVERTLEPILEGRSRGIARAGQRGEDALNAFLELRVLDPAMGSAHFLVGACAYIAQYVATDPSYGGTLALEEIQRLVAERCLYGVDVNALAVELAQLSLWLTTVRYGEPLTFLHNLREGNSLVGADVTALLAGGEDVFAQRLAREAESLLARETAIASSETDVHEKERLARAAQALRRPLEQYATDYVAGAFTSSVGRPFHWELEFPEVFLGPDGRPRPDGGFDAVIGNPPWIRIQALGRELADYCRSRYATATGAFDTYVVFLERSLALLGASGRLGFIVPNLLLKVDYAQRLRERFADQQLVEEIIDFGDAQLFEQATNYSCILILDRGGRAEFSYRRVRGDRIAVRQALANLDATPTERFSAARFGREPWVLAAGDEARLLRHVLDGAERLDTMTRQIFQGLITSADPIYILEDRGRRGANRVVYSRASGRELELEETLLHRLASGTDVNRYAFEPLRSLLLFPYRSDIGRMRLLTPSELAALPLTEAYLHGHEQRLRDREGGRMDSAAWYAFGRTQSLDAHDLPKLGVAATVRRLEVAADAAGAVYFHNVRVNGILLRTDGPSLWTLLALLNSRLLDFVFRRGAREHAGGHYAANKQFIAPLPIRPLDSDQVRTLDALGKRLHENTAALGEERQGFLDWLSDVLGTRTSALPGITILRRYDEHDVGELLAVLQASRTKLAQDPLSRSFRDRFTREHSTSVERLRPLAHAIAADETLADEAVYELYELDASQRAMINAEYHDR